MIGFLARFGQAQELRGVVRDSASRRPIAGAVLVLMDSSGATLGRNITNDRGAYRIALSPRIRRMQVLRIGFRPRDLRVPTIDTGVATLDVTLVALPTLLEPVLVSDRSRCPRRADRAATFALWEQARVGLLATIVARQANPASFVRLRFDRRMKDGGDEIRSQSVWMDSTSTTRPFVAWRTASEFVERGFMADSSGHALYAGPDADVLLDPAFVDGYCYHIADPDRTRPNEIGLAFAPASRKRGRIDIEGAVWIDSTTRTLTHIAYRYIGMDPQIARLDPGGVIGFRPMTNGTVMIDRWHIRVVVPDTSGSTVVGVIRGLPLETRQIGGEVATATWNDGLVWKNSLGGLRGRVVPAESGTMVRLINTPYETTTDSAGSFEMSNLLPGPYTVAVVDPRLVDVGIVLKTGIAFTAVRDSTLSILVEVPSAERYMAGVCEGDGGNKAKAVLTARVKLPNGLPAPDASITVRRARSSGNAHPAEGKTDKNGLYHLCGAPIGVMLEIRADYNGLPPVIAQTQLDAAIGSIVLQFKNSSTPP
jgi:hypothetical protein